MSLRNLHLISLLLTLVLISAHHLQHHKDNQRMRGRQWPPPVVKKNVFISRGWGASGFPLSTESVDGQKQLNGVEGPWTGQGGGGGGQSASSSNKVKFMRQLLNPEYLRGKGGAQHRNNYSIPQLFVSYGWGPMG